MHVSRSAQAVLEYACLFSHVQGRFPTPGEIGRMFSLDPGGVDALLSQLYEARRIWRDYQTGGIYLAKVPRHLFCRPHPNRSSFAPTQP